MFTRGFLIALALVASSVLQPEASYGAGEKCSEECVIQLFREIAGIYRPSGKEEKIRTYIIEKGATAEENGEWAPGDISYSRDEVGNLVLRIPATGEFEGEGLKPIGLQAHLDMVYAVENEPVGTSLEEFYADYFGKGVDLVETDGWLHAPNYESTIGADNGIGVAIALRYLLDSSIDHPPLELIFTVQEEQGSVGAGKFNIPLGASVIISLDEFETGVITHGSLGGERFQVRGTFPTASLPREMRGFRVTLTGLSGGNSGEDIHRKRLNAVKVLGPLLQAIHVLDERTYVISARAGDINGLNKIPTAFEVTLAVSATIEKKQVNKEVNDVIFGLVTKADEEDWDKITLSVDMVDLTSTKGALDPETTQQLYASLLNAPNGVIRKDTAYPKRPNLGITSNLGYLRIETVEREDSKGPATEVQIAFMARGLRSDPLREERQNIIEALMSAWKTKEQVKSSPIRVYAPWLTEPDSWVIQLGLSEKIPGLTKAFVAPGGLEASIFSVKLPNTWIIVIGADIKGAHGAGEKLRTASVKETMQTVDQYLREIGRSEQFRENGKDATGE